MKSRLLHRDPQTYILVFADGDEVSSGIKQFATDHDVRSGYFVGLGAFSTATVAFFDMQRKEYDPIRIREQVEVLSLTGNLSRHEGRPAVHAHVVIGRRDGSALGGHLLEGHVRPTLEVIVTVYAEPVERRRDEATGLPLIDVAE